MKAKHRLQRRIALSLVLLASMSIALEHGFTSDQVKVELINIENALAAAVVDSDIAVLDSTYAEDFVFTHSDGRVDTKENWLNDLRNNDQIYVSRSIDSIEVELHGDIAITTGRIHIKTELDDPLNYRPERTIALRRGHYAALDFHLADVFPGWRCRRTSFGSAVR